MENKNNLTELHNYITNQIIEERTREMAEAIAQKRTEAKVAEESYQEDIKAMEAAGIKVANLEALDVEHGANADVELKVIEDKMIELSQEPSEATIGLDVEKAFLPQDALVLSPAWVADFSDDDAQDKLTGASSITPQTLLSGGGCKDKYVWAKGGGSGIAGTGVGKIQSWVDFGFWFKPSASRFYSIRPHFRFRGFYIVKANDTLYNSKFARVKVSAWTNVYQYNWKGWNHIDVLNVGDNNINRGKRFDAERNMHTSYLLGGGDWAYIRCTIGLYAYARGGGSYAKLDFATGAANYLCVPYCYVY